MYRKYNYRGMWIYQNINGSQFNTTYWTVANPRKIDKTGNLLHAHVNTEGIAKKLVDCFCKLHNGGRLDKYQRDLRNKAMRLSGFYILSK